ncbi:glycosyltransferase [Brevundimonas sp.]|uniref:glycosyltransferase n=1 Tax=Brevundimonas sp. TaxID=1871086 RepID=UPI00184C9EDF|nr:glycosyltransferase [Brevundimonas sp.]MBA4809155.1 glucuronosyltransferase [Brevundimonas sp.]
MILLTIGTQLPFDRLVKALDEISPSLNRPIFGQIGKSSYRPTSFQWAERLAPKDFDEKFSAATVIVSHAGIGTILTAQKYGKPIILFPREARFGEHRNDHQLATCNQLAGRPGIGVARTPRELFLLIQSGTLVGASAEELQQKRDAFVANLGRKIAILAGGR